MKCIYISKNSLNLHGYKAAIEVIALSGFTKDLKALSKKYPSILEDVIALISQLQHNPASGVSLGSGFYKLRLSITSKKVGRSGGARVITNVRVVNQIVYLVTIYDKSEKETVTTRELRDYLKQLITKEK